MQETDIEKGKRIVNAKKRIIETLEERKQAVQFGALQEVWKINYASSAQDIKAELNTAQKRIAVIDGWIKNIEGKISEESTSEEIATINDFALIIDAASNIPETNHL